MPLHVDEAWLRKAFQVSRMIGRGEAVWTCRKADTQPHPRSPAWRCWELRCPKGGPRSAGARPPAGWWPGAGRSGRFEQEIHTVLLCFHAFHHKSTTGTNTNVSFAWAGPTGKGCRDVRRERTPWAQLGEVGPSGQSRGTFRNRAPGWTAGRVVRPARIRGWGRREPRCLGGGWGGPS